VDVHAYDGTLSGHYRGMDNGQPFAVDLRDDLGLGRDGTKPGVGLEYQGHRFGLEFSLDQQHFRGSQLAKVPFTVNGQTYQAGVLVNSTVKATHTVFNWTIRALAFDHAWLGVDLGVRGISLDLRASGLEPFTQQNALASYKASYPIPQVGLSAGFNASRSRLVGRAFYHRLQYEGATYTAAGGDLRYFPVSWAGLRAFTATERLRVPQGSINKDIDIALDQTGSGAGVVFRF
jgi:hypothetical protein